MLILATSSLTFHSYFPLFDVNHMKIVNCSNLIIIFFSSSCTLGDFGQALHIRSCHKDLILTRKSHNCSGIAFIQGDSEGGSKLIEQILPDHVIFMGVKVIVKIINSIFSCFQHHLVPKLFVKILCIMLFVFLNLLKYLSCLDIILWILAVIQGLFLNDNALGLTPVRGTCVVTHLESSLQKKANFLSTSSSSFSSLFQLMLENSSTKSCLLKLE